MAEHNELGLRGELMAKEYLEKQGFGILEINWRYKRAEVDIIATKGEMLVLVEVKTRKGNYFGFPEESVNEKKQEMLLQAAWEYMEKHGLEGEVRFDIVSIIFDKDKSELFHIEDAFFPGASPD